MSAVPAGARRALLIGVPYYKSSAIRPLDVVVDDLALVEAALKESRYEKVHRINTDVLGETSASAIEEAIAVFCTEPASRGASLLIYFSGHGVHRNGEDFMVASDTNFAMPHALDRTLVRIDQGEIFNESKANSILFFVDACREGIETAAKGMAAINSWGSAQARHVAAQRRATVFSCSRGQLSRFVDQDGLRYSLFSRALATVLHPSHAAATFKDLFEALSQEVDRLAVLHEKPAQTVRLAHELQVKDPLWDLVVAESAVHATLVREDDPWLTAVERSACWEQLGQKDADVQRTAALRLVRQCAVQRDRAAVGCAADPWRDDALPVRVLERAGFLLKEAGAACKLQPAEAFCLVTAPFVAAALFDAGHARLAQAGAPLDLAPRSAGLPERDALQRVHQSAPQLVRKAGALAQRGHRIEHDAIAWWMLRRAVRASALAWQPEGSDPRAGFMAQSLWDALGDALPGKDLGADIQRDLLLGLARLLSAEPEWTERDNLPSVLRADMVVAAGTGREQGLRSRMLAWLLALSSRMALDPMALPEVVIDHIGVADPVRPADAVALCNAVEWLPHADGRAAHCVCSHPALDLGLRECVQAGDAVLVRMHARRAGRLDSLEPLEGLPRRLYDTGIRPLQAGDAPLYTTPHVTFRLAQREVRELLMGEQLYGDPSLAIREMYQNALDACRYRRARLELLRRAKGYVGPAWEGRIAFRQYLEADGRMVLECRDNGIGMGRRELLQAFAAVGKRFADMPDFIDEQAEWQRLDPPVRMYPNSRFGIGVLSYFMLADELHIETCRLDQAGRPGVRLVATVSSAGSLFRIREESAGAADAGTVLRLFLSRTHYVKKTDASGQGQEQPISCVATLRDLLWTAEFATAATEPQEELQWEPAQFMPPRRPHALLEQPLSYLQGLGGVPLWWHPESGDGYQQKGRLLAEGIATETRRFGHTVNLTGAHRPRLTVDRRSVLDADEDYLRDLRRQGVPALCPPPDWLDQHWLWGLLKTDTQAAQALADLLQAADLSLPLHVASASALQVPMARFGVSASDAVLVGVCESLLSDDRQLWMLDHELDRLRDCLPPWLLPVRLAMWRDIGLPMPAVDGFPALPAAGGSVHLAADDAPLLAVLQTGFRKWGEAHASLPHIALAAQRLGLSLAQAQARLARFVPAGLAVDEVPEALGGLQPDTNDLRLVALRPGFEHGFVKELLPLDIAARALATGMPAAKALDRLQRLAPVFGLELPPPEAVLLAATLGRDDLLLLSQDCDAQGPWLAGELPAAHLAAVAAVLDRPLQAIVDHAHRLSALGVQPAAVPAHALRVDWARARRAAVPILLDEPRVRAIEIAVHARRTERSLGVALADFGAYRDAGYAVPAWPDAVAALRLDKDDLACLSSDIDAMAPWRDEAPDLLRMVLLRGKLQWPVDRLLARLRALAPVFGWQLAACDPAALEPIGADEAACLARDIDGRSPWQADVPTLLRTIALRAKLQWEPGHLMARLQVLAPLFGWELPAPDLDALGRIGADDLGLAQACSAPVVGQPDDGGISLWHLALVAVGLDCDLQAARARLTVFADVGCRLAPVPPELAAFQPVEGELALFLDTELEAVQPAPDWDVVASSALAQEHGVGAALELLRKYLPLGAVLPTPP